ESGVLAFVHRRLAEYFYTRDLMARGLAPPVKSIAEDSKLREALVLYCCVAADALAAAIARQCWERIQVIVEDEAIVVETDRYQAQPHLRFLLDAFRHNPKLLGDAQQKLADYIERCLVLPSPLITLFDNYKASFGW